MAKKRYLVTGGAGFIGSHVAEALVKKGYRVRIFDNLSTGSKENIAGFIKKVEFVKGDLRRPADLKKAMKGVDGVFHLGAIRAVERSVDNPTETHDTNVTGTLNLLVAARDAKVKRVIYTSSSSAYGDNKVFPLKESVAPNPMSPYAAAKLMGEYYCRNFTHLYGLETISLRYFNVFGPRQNPESRYSAVIPIFIYHMLKNKSPVIHWDGKQSRDFSYVDNVVEGNLKAMNASKKAVGEVFNIACFEEYSVNDIYREIAKILGIKGLKPKYTPKRAGDVRRTLADITKAKKLLGFKVQTRFPEGMKKTVQWFLDSGIWKRVQV